MSYQTMHKSEIMKQLIEAFDVLNSVRIKVDERNRERVSYIQSEVCNLMEVIDSEGL